MTINRVGSNPHPFLFGVKMALAAYVTLVRIQRILGAARVTTEAQIGFTRVMVDGQIIGALYPGDKVSMADMAGSHISDDDLAAIDRG